MVTIFRRGIPSTMDVMKRTDPFVDDILLKDFISNIHKANHDRGKKHKKTPRTLMI